MAKLKDPRTNWKYVLVVIILAFVIGEGILGYTKWITREIISFTQFPEIKKPEKVIEDETAYWKTYRNEEYGFEVKYPKDARMIEEGFIKLPFTQGTTLVEKSLRIGVIAEKCPPMEGLEIRKPEIIRVGDIEFTKEVKGEAAAGSVYEDTIYSTMKDGYCFYLDFTLHSINPGHLTIPLQNFDYRKEVEVFDRIVSTFKFFQQ